ncbi:MAG TPA: GDYXXLXY domain-containing protein [Caulobacteraceae bacterium]|nr:GDYXXLXY domain-containing protein [Caulobacteraceae bacterium]
MPPAWIRIIAVAALSIVALVGLVVHEGLARDAGTEVVMPMQPVDPQSLLSGHYVVISLQEQLATGQGCPPGAETGILPNFDASMRKPRWVALTVGAGGHARVAGVTDLQRAAKGFAPLVADGDAYCVASAPDAPGFVATWLGVDRFHLDQAEAQRIAAAMSPTSDQPAPVSAILSIGADGRTRMKGVIIGAQRIAPNWY